MKKTWIASVAFFLLGAMILAGCGETVRGVWRDGQRIGKGVKTVFVTEQ